MDKMYDVIVVGELVKGVRGVRNCNGLDRGIVNLVALGNGVLDAGIHGLAPALVVNGIGVDDSNGNALGDGGAAERQHHQGREKNSDLLHDRMLLYICVGCVGCAIGAQSLSIPEILREKSANVNEMTDDLKGEL